MVELSIVVIGEMNVLNVKGRIDSITSPEIERKLNDVIDKGLRTVVIDFKEVAYLSSAGLRIFLMFQKQLKNAGGEIIFLNVANKIYEIFQMCGFAQLFKFFNSFEDFMLTQDQTTTPKNYKKIINGINFEVLGNYITEKMKLQVFGDSEKVNSSSYSKNDVVTRPSSDFKYGTGLSTYGKIYDEYKEYFGESLILKNNLFFYPAVKNSAVDYIVYYDNSIGIEYNYLHGFGFNGEFNKLISFNSHERFIKINEVISSIFEFTQSNLIGMVFIAESKGFWGMNLKKVPLEENKPNDGSMIFDNKNIFDWINYPVEPSDIGNIIVGVGVARRNENISEGNIDLVINKGNLMHTHSAICSKGIISNDLNLFESEIIRVINEFQMLKIQHMLPNSLFSSGMVGIIELEA